ncbi:hypothetical protein AAHB53_28705 [Niallia circulans]
MNLIIGKKDEITGEWIEVPYTLDPKKTYLVLFLSKNRFGSEEEQIIYEANYSINAFEEVAFVKSAKNRWCILKGNSYV